MYYVGVLTRNGWWENYSLITAVISQMEKASVKVVSVADVACANTQTASSAVLALEIANEFLISTKREKGNVIEETKKTQWQCNFNEHGTATTCKDPLRRHRESCVQSSVRPRGEQRGRRLSVVKRGLSCNLMM